MSLFNELKRRNVFRVSIAYVAVAWLIAQVLQMVFESFATPDWVMKTILVLLATGLPFAVFFAWAFEMTPEGLKRESEVDRNQSITTQTGRKLDFLIIGVLVLVLGYFAYDKFVLDPSRDAELVKVTTETVTEQATESGKAKTEGNSIAVLPFVNMSDDPANEYFSDGISEEILNALAKVKDLKVTGRTSSFAFKGRNEDLRTIGEALGVSHILEGSVRKSGIKVRITAQLIKTDDGFHLWSATYDRELTDIFAIQDEIAQAIFQQLIGHLTGDGVEIQFAASRVDVDAFDLYLEAKQKIYTRKRLPLEQAAVLLEQAIAIDPGYAPAYAQRGITSLLLSEGQYGTIPMREAAAQAKPMFDKALSLDQESAEAWAGQGLLYLLATSEPVKAVEVLERALAINPSLVNARHWLASAVMGMGKRNEGNRIRQEVLLRDPLYLPGIDSVLDDYMMFGEIDQAQALMNRVRPFMPASRTIVGWEGVLHFVAGRIADSLPYFESAYETEPDNATSRGQLSRVLLFSMQYERDGWSEHNSLGLIAFSYQRLGNVEKFEEAMSRFKAALDYQRQNGANNHHFAFAEAVYAVLAFDHETALGRLARAFENGFTVDPQLSRTWPMFEPLDGNPRFEAIMNHMVEHLNSERAKLGLEPVRRDSVM